MKTAVAEVRAGSHRCRAQILFDEGAQRSFMTQQLARDLNIQPYKCERICVSAFGGEAVPKELQLTSVAIQTKDGGEVPVSALVVPKIAASLQNLVPTPGDKYPHLHGLPLTHPVVNDNFEISLLIGADFYCKTRSSGEMALLPWSPRLDIFSQAHSPHHTLNSMTLTYFMLELWEWKVPILLSFGMLNLQALYPSLNPQTLMINSSSLPT